MTIKQAADIAYDEFAKSAKDGCAGTPEGAAKALPILKTLLAQAQQADIDQLIDEEKEAERLAEIAASYDEAWY